ncbi:MAG TPA: RHS repeat-associated core domain-containing protein, partial [Chroococcales cyanobacterium]
NSIDWVYDAMSRITSETNALGEFDYSYVDDAAGYSKGTSRLSSINYPNGQTTYFNWFGNEKDQRLQSILNLKSDGTALSNFGYKYDPAGQITLWQQQQGPFNNKMYQLKYDNAGQLISAQSGLMAVAGKPFGNQYFYSYDKGANRTSVQQSVAQPCVFGGSLTTGDEVTVTIYDSALSGGQESVSYILQGWESSLLDLNNMICGNICADSALQAAGINAIPWNQTLYLNSTSPNQTTFDVTFSSGATETVTYGLPANQNAIGEPSNSYQLGNVVGDITAGDELTLTVHDPGLTGGSKSLSYTIQTGDDAPYINWNFMNAINGDTDLSGLGISATLYQNTLVIFSYSDNTTTYTQSASTGATERLEFDLNANPIMNALVGGSVTPGDELTITAYDPSLSGGSASVTYEVQSGDDLQSIAQGIATAIQNDSVLPFLLFAYAFSGDTRVNLEAVSPTLTTYRATVSAGATETLGIGYNTNGLQTAALTGTITPGDVITLTVQDPALPGGQKSASYTIQSGDDAGWAISSLAGIIDADSDLLGIGLSAWTGGPTMYLYSTSSNATTYLASVSSSAIEALTLGPGSAGTTQYAYNNVNEMVAINPGGNVSVQGTTNKAIENASVATPVVQISATPPAPTTYSGTVSTSGTETVTFWQNINGSAWATIDGTVTTGDSVTIAVFNDALPDGQINLTYVVQSGDTVDDIASALSYAIDSDSNLAGIGLTSTSSAGDVFTDPENTTTYSASTSIGASESIDLGYNNAGNTSAVLSGDVTAGDTITVTASNPLLPSGTASATYTVISGDQLVDVAAGLAAAINGNSDLTTLGLSATNTANAQLADSETFSANAATASGANSTTVSATDGGSNTVTDPYPIQVQGGNSADLTYDLNGNLTSDGTNDYAWDCENRLIKITYPGSGNYTAFKFDGFGRCVDIREFSNNTEDVQSQFVWTGQHRSEDRDGFGVISRQYFARGETVDNSPYFYAKDHQSSIREFTSSDAALHAQYNYSPDGQATASGDVSSNYRYARSYYHERSHLYLTLFRAYSPLINRWLSRDPSKMSESSCVYVSNDPINRIDRLGLQDNPAYDQDSAPYDEDTAQINCIGYAFQIGHDVEPKVGQSLQDMFSKLEKGSWTCNPASSTAECEKQCKSCHKKTIVVLYQKGKTNDPWTEKYDPAHPLAPHAFGFDTPEAPGQWSSWEAGASP